MGISYRKRFASLLLAALLSLSLVPAVAFAGQTSPGGSSASLVAQGAIAGQASQNASGLKSKAKPTLAELREAYSALPAHPSVSGGLWATSPDIDSYKAGTLSAASLKYAQGYLNLIRRSANLDPVTFEGTLNANAAQGALILARLDKGLSHFPSTPSGVTDVQANPGKAACASSNLSYSWGYSTPLQTAIQGQMDDENVGNMEIVGHRRWLIAPSTSTMGIGAAQSASGSFFTAVRVFSSYGSDESYGMVERNGSTDYDYVAWPASGAFLNDLFNVGVPWSVALNEELYAQPSASSVKVVVKRLSDGKSWTLDASDATPTSTGEFFAVDSTGYGEGWCIIFNPGSANLGTDQYKGSYSVNITGLQTAAGETTSLSYQVDFASAKIDLSTEATVAKVANATYTGRAHKPSPIVKVGSTTLKKGSDYTVAYEDNVNAGTARIVVTGMGKYTGTRTATFSIAKASQVIKVKKAKVAKTYKGKKLVKKRKLAKSQTIKLAKLVKPSAKTTVKYAKANKKGGSKIAVAKNGKVTVKKGLKRGTYKVKVKLTAAKSANYKAAAAKTIALTIKVK